MIDINNGWSRYDSSGTNSYYGYSLVQNPADTDNSFSIRQVSGGSSSNTKWANGDITYFGSSWTNRASYFTSPTSSLGFTWSVTTASDTRFASFTWSIIPGVDRYIISTQDSGSRFLSSGGTLIMSPNNPRKYSESLNNTSHYVQYFQGSGTYTVTISATNSVGYTSSAATIYFAS